MKFLYLLKSNLVVYFWTYLAGIFILSPAVGILNALRSMSWPGLSDLFALSGIVLIYGIFYCWIPLLILLTYNLVVAGFRLRSQSSRIFSGAGLCLVLTFPFVLLHWRDYQGRLLFLAIFTFFGAAMGYYHFRKVEI